MSRSDIAHLATTHIDEAVAVLGLIYPTVTADRASRLSLARAVRLLCKVYPGTLAVLTAAKLPASRPQTYLWG
eukprot:54099-Eustigmatos_ZCMA.PRE.1